MIKTSIFVSLPQQTTSSASSINNPPLESKLKREGLGDEKREKLRNTESDSLSRGAVIFSCSTGMSAFTFSILDNWFSSSALTVLLNGREPESIAVKLSVLIMSALLGGYLGYSSQRSKSITK